MSEQQPYEISVVTPFHNVDLRYFKAAVDSMLAQTIGFEKIQWIIVVHNCEPTYMPALKEMLGKYPNVILAELNNEARTPSSPRNHGVRLATAPYVGYLDGDDSYLPNCLKECVRHIRETKAQVVYFRREDELADESLGAMTEVVPWNQLKERIVIERGNWSDMQRIFDGRYVFVTSKIFDLAYLRRMKIEFDETIPYCEDSMYSMCALAQADRICILPQLIGYHYFINGSSLVQSSKKDSKTLVAYARGLAKVFQRGFDFGIDDSYLIQRLTTQMCRFILHSDMEPEDLAEIKRLLAPFIYRMSPIKPSKIISREWSDYAITMCREVMLNADALKDNAVLQALGSGLMDMRRILAANAGSDFGQEYLFDHIKTIDAYQFRVPLSRVASYRKLINLQMNIGERGILTSDPIVGYIREGDAVVPFTEAHLKPYVLAVAKVLKGHHNLWVAQCELAGRVLNDRTRIHSLGSVIVRGYFFTYVYGGGRRPATFSMPDGEFFSETADANDYGNILHYALLDREIDQIVAADATRIARMFDLLETDSAAMLEKVRAVDPARAEEVAAAFADFAAGREPCFARRIWPKLGRVVACGTGSHAAAREKVRRFIGDVTWNNGPVFLSEAVLAHAEADGSDRYVFDGSGCFCEFFQNDTDDILKPFTRSGLQAGHTYNVIVTNSAGLYRVVTDAEIKVVENGVDGLIVELFV